MKHIHRFFVSGDIAAGDSVRLDDNDSFHASRVLRLKRGSLMELADAAGRVFEAVVERIDGPVEVTVGEEVGGGEPAGPAQAAPVELTVAQALPKGKKFDLVVEKLSEIGVAGLVPVFTGKSVARPARDSDEKLERWRRIARAAAGQSKRTRVMEIAAPVKLERWLKECSQPLLALATEAGARPLTDALLCVTEAAVGPGKTAAFEPGKTAAPRPERLSLLVGPEAGFSDSEIEMMAGAGAVFASLGTQVLRTETAALVAAAIVMNRLGALG
ncbi:MAG: 16S rRNA (uracil(1498)-N(3))-methyltransferase [Actinobacteria bacterium]|nr:16S rRNA (uracil(1498)-N(3))-methyltransferase [Actinomycetota bacterium]